MALVSCCGRLPNLSLCSSSIEALASAAFCLLLFWQAAWSDGSGGQVWEWQGKAPRQFRHFEVKAGDKAHPDCSHPGFTLCDSWVNPGLTFNFEHGDIHPRSLDCSEFPPPAGTALSLSELMFDTACAVCFHEYGDV